MAYVHVYLSADGAEFRSYRNALRRDLARLNICVAVQEDFILAGSEALDILDDYIRRCDAVIHLVGDMAGEPAQATMVDVIRNRYPELGKMVPPLAPFLQAGAPALPYTQWEAWLALYHGKPLVIAVPEESAPRDARDEPTLEQRAAQRAHLQRLAAVERYPDIRFASSDWLVVEVLRFKLADILAQAGLPKKPIHLPYPSLGDLFKGRAEMLHELCSGLTSVPAIGPSPIVGRAVHGVDGVGKTRLAVEYAWRHAEDYAALLFVAADSRETLQRNLAAMCAPALFDLPQHQVTEQAAQFSAVLAWLQRNRGWLLILDNVDTEAAARAVEALLPQLTGGHVLITSRLTNWSGSVQALPLDVPDTPTAVDFLLARTEARRRKHADDADQASILAVELEGLGLALEQAGACIAQRHLTMADYLAEWRAQRNKVLAWYDQRRMQYPKSVAVTCLTAIDQLGESARRLLEDLAWLAPDPIPESLLATAVPGLPQKDAYAALAELQAYSLVTRGAGASTFSIHRLVQAVTRRGADAGRLREALDWLDAAFVGEPQDVRSWPVLEPLLAHVCAVASHADEAGIADPTARLMNQAGMLLDVKGLHAEAEPLYARALAIVEKALGPDHPNVAMSLNNLAELYRMNGAYAKAEPLYARALAIWEKTLGPGHPNVAASLNNLAELYKAQGAYMKAKPIMHRALTILVASLGADHPYSQTVRGNYDALLGEMDQRKIDVLQRFKSAIRHLLP